MGVARQASPFRRTDFLTTGRRWTQRGARDSLVVCASLIGDFRSPRTVVARLSIHGVCVVEANSLDGMDAAYSSGAAKGLAGGRRGGLGGGSGSVAGAGSGSDSGSGSGSGMGAGAGVGVGVCAGGVEGTKGLAAALAAATAARVSRWRMAKKA